MYPLTPNQIIEGALVADPSNLGPAQKIATWLREKIGTSTHSAYVVRTNQGDFMGVIAHGQDRVLSREPDTLRKIADWCNRAADFIEKG